MVNSRKQRQKFSKHQTVAAYMMIATSVILWVIEGIGWQPFSRQPGFGILPWALLVIGTTIALQLNIVRLLRGALQVDEDEEEDKA